MYTMLINQHLVPTEVHSVHAERYEKGHRESVEERTSIPNTSSWHSIQLSVRI